MTTPPAPTRPPAGGPPAGAGAASSIEGADSADLLEALRAAGLDPEASGRRLAEYSYDASNYRIRPLAVVFPRTEDEVAATLRVCHAEGVTVIPRGGGTGMAGNTIGRGVVLDLSRHLNRVLDATAEPVTRDGHGYPGLATAEAGCVLTDLRAAAERGSGGTLTFAPDPSSQARACLGGAVGNDACGNHSVRYGRMADHVVELRLVTVEGHRLTATRSGIRATYPDDDAAGARAAQLEGDLRDLAAEHLAAFRTELGRIPRQVSGYHLRHLLPEEGFDVARALVGSEGTCGVITAVTVGLVPKAARTSLLVVGYDDVVGAARDVPLLLDYRPTAVEGIDEIIARTVRIRRGPDAVAELPEGRAWLFVELDDEPGDTAAGSGDLDERTADLARRLVDDGHALDVLVVDSPTERADLWRVREDGAGLSSRLTDPDTGDLVETWAGWEDSAVPPERLADYLADFRELLARFDLTGVMYGHFGAGCMHIRISFDFRSADGRTAYREFCTEAARLVVSYGGSLSGEHGDGRARSEFLPLMYSPEMISAFESFAAIWDPAGRMSPGGLRGTRPMDADLALDHSDAPNRHTDLGLLTAADGRHPVEACIGVGRCRTSSGGVMCPSYRATRDEKDSTRGRARVLQELIRGELPGGVHDPAVEESLEHCLACKACSSDCPTGVDMATYKSQVLDQRYRGRIRPLVHYSLGKLPTWLKATVHVAGPLNAVLGTRAGQAAARLGGIASGRTLPRFASAGELRAELARTPDSVWQVPSAGPAVSSAGPAAASTSAEVVLFLDSFTRGLRPSVAGAAARVLGQAHTSVACSATHCCGLTDITTGRLDSARRRLLATARHLDGIRGPGGENIPVVVVEPSCAATLRDDLPRLLDTGGAGADSPASDDPDLADLARRVSERIRSAAGHLGDLAAAGQAPSWPGDSAPEHVVVQTHCHEYATFGNRVQRRMLGALGVTDIREATGCCGIAGDFGFTHGHAEVADAVAELALAPALRESPEAPVLTDGFSCHAQVAHLAATDSACSPAGVLREGRHIFEFLDPDPLRPGGST